MCMTVKLDVEDNCELLCDFSYRYIHVGGAQLKRIMPQGRRELLTACRYWRILWRLYRCLGLCRYLVHAQARTTCTPFFNTDETNLEKHRHPNVCRPLL